MSDVTPPTGPVPEDNLPGHHPEQEQDKPTGPPPRPRARAVTKTATETVEGPAEATITDLASTRRANAKGRFRFAFEPRIAPFSYLLGVNPWTTRVDVGDGELRIRFGALTLKTSLDNVGGAEVTGPYAWYRVAGPPHLSLKDRGLTLATSTRRGVCIRFRAPVGALRHPAVTVTVEDCDGLAEVLSFG